jgi:hypothetical protein
MFGAVEVPCSVLVLRRITAAHVPAFHAQAQVDPAIARLDAILAYMSCGRADLGRLLEVSSISGHALFSWAATAVSTAGLSKAFRSHLPASAPAS